MSFSIYRNSQIVNLSVTRFGQTGPQGEQGPPGPAGPSEWGGIEGDIADQEDLQEALDAKANVSGQVFTGPISATNLTGTNTGDQDLSGYALADEVASAAVQLPYEALPSVVLFHDDMSGDNANIAALGTRACEPGPGIFTVGALPGNSTVRYENGVQRMTNIPQGSGNVCGYYDAQTAAPGLTIIAYVDPAWAPGALGQTRVGFSDQTTAPRHRAGMVNLTSEAPHTYPLVKISTGSSSSDDNEYSVNFGTFNQSETVGVRVTLDANSRPEFFIQGGRYADMGFHLYSENWFSLGKAATAVTGTLYPMVANQFYGTAVVREVIGLSSYTGSPRFRNLDYTRQINGVHIPTFGRDPVTGLVMLAWNKGTIHVGPGDSAIRYSVLLNGQWTTEADLIAAPISPAGQAVQSLSVVNGTLRLVYWKNSNGADGGTLYWRTVSINAGTGAATLGTETLMGVTGTGNLNFSPILTLESGRLIIPYHKNSPINTYVSVSDDNGATWTESVVSSSPPAGAGSIIEPTLIQESGGVVGMYLRTTGNDRVTYYTRCTSPDASPPVWSTPVPVKAIPQPASSGGRVQALLMADGTKLVIGTDQKTTRRNVTIWEVGDNAVILNKTRIGDINPLQEVAIGIGIQQYPAIMENGDDLIIAYSEQPNSGANLASSIRVLTWRWTQPVANEAGGDGDKSEPRDITPRPVLAAVPIAYSTTPTPDMSLGNTFHITLTASTATVGAPLNPQPWETLTLIVNQGGAGSYTMAWNSIFEFDGLVPTFQTAVNASDVFVFRYNAIQNKWIRLSSSALSSTLLLGKTITAGGTTGARTINQATGSVNFAAAASSLVVTNSLVTANSVIIATVGTNDINMSAVKCVAAAGSFTMYPDAPPAAETRVNFLLTN